MKNLIKVSLTLAVASMTFAGCSCFKEMSKNSSSVQISTNPELLELNNGKVFTTVTVEFPAEYFDKKAVARVTPIIVFEGGQVLGEPIYFQGEKVEDNYIVVGENGDKYEHRVEFDYTPAMQESKLVIAYEFKCKGDDEFTLFNANENSVITDEQAEVIAANPKGAEAAAIFASCGIEVAEGVNTLQSDIKYESVMAVAPNNYKRVTNETKKASVMYSISSSKVAKNALSSEEVEAFESGVNAYNNNDRAEQKLFANGYASPDGPENFNDKLSKARSESAKVAMDKLLKEYGLNIDAAAYGEDWDGFKELVLSSDIKDKNLILQVLSLHSSATDREAEIKNLAAVYGELKNDILPLLRRTQMVTSADITGKSDAEMLALVEAGNLSALTNEELLFVAELVETPAQKAKVLEYTAATYSDARAYNNLAVVYSAQGEDAKALAAMNKAVKAGAASADTNKNLALVNLANNNVDEANKYIASADASTKSAVAAAKGDYAAAKNLSGYNAAIVDVMNNNYASAKKNIADDKSADADYLRAVIAVREGEVKVAESHLKSAVAKNADLKAKAQSDVNLKPVFANGFAF